MRNPLAILLLPLLAAGCARAEAAPTASPPPVPVRVEAASPPPTACGVELTGTLRADRRVELAFKVPGYVTGLARHDGRPLEVGDHVKRGEVLATIRASDYAAKSMELAGLQGQTSASRAQAELDEARAARMLEKSAIPRAEYDAAKNRLDAARAAENATAAGRQSADILLGDTRLVAPFDATVLARHVEAGTLVAGGTPAYALGALDTMRIDVAVPEGPASRLAPGVEVGFRVTGREGRLVARVLTVSPRVDARTRLVPVELVTPNGEGTLRDGRPVRVAVAEACVTGTAMVPVASLVRPGGDAGRAIVWIASADRGVGRAERREVEVRGLVGASVVVTGAVAPGERVVTMGSTVVSESTKVEVLP